MLALMNELVLANTETLATAIRNFVGPILMVVVGIIAITFLVRREMTQFITFLIIAVVVFAIFYAPSIIKNLAQGVAGSAGGEWTG